jgi:type VI secretion system protein ImpG
METLIPYIQDELASYRRDCKELVARFPAFAGKLGITEDGCGDPQVDHLLQSCGLFSARIRKTLDDDFPRFTGAMLQATYPHYLRTHPSCSIVAIEHDAARMHRPRKIARGTELRSRVVQGVRCQFRTSSDVVLSPLAVASACFIPAAAAPAGHRLDHACDAALVIHFTSPVALADLGMKRLSLFIDGDPSLCAAVRDTLFLHTGRAFARASDNTPWQELPAFPIRPAGFEDDEALLPWPARSHPVYRLLTEYFAFPDEFNFIEVDLAAVLAAAPRTGNTFTLHLPVRGLAREGARARTLASLGASNLRTHCTPVTNLFTRGAAPVDLHRRATEYPVVIDLARPAACELYSIDAARLVTGTGANQRIAELRPFYGPQHGQGTAGSRHGGYWTIHRDDMTAQCDPGHEVRITIVDDDMQPAVPEAQTLSLDVTCSNRDLPSQLPYGSAGGDLDANGLLDSSPIRFLRKPTPSRRFPSDGRGQWRLIAHLALNQRALSDIGLVELRKMLNLYDLPHSPVSQRQIAGIVALSSSAVHEWVKTGHRSALMPGVEIRLTLDESAYAGSGLHVFIELLDRFFALYGQINIYTRLTVVSATTGEEILACRPRSGTILLA